LILAQSERWRRGLGMQVERFFYESCKFFARKKCKSCFRIAAKG